MHVADVAETRETFAILGDTGRSQAGVIVLPPGERTGGPSNVHPDSDQWVYVRAGNGTAVVEGDRIDLQEGRLVGIAAGEAHELIADADARLELVTVYAPPAY